MSPIIKTDWVALKKIIIQVKPFNLCKIWVLYVVS